MRHHHQYPQDLGSQNAKRSRTYALRAVRLRSLDPRLVVLFVFATLALLPFAFARASAHAAAVAAATAEVPIALSAAEPQRGTARGVRTRRAAPSQRPRVNYANFDHNVKGHYENCASCHRLTSFEKSDLTDYPDHPSCVSCHRQQFFSGARPLICSNCHTVVSPRSSARFQFPKPNIATEFADIFPHNKHVKTTVLAQFKKLLGKQSNTQGSCVFCHTVNDTKYALPANAPADAFVPAAGTFKATPTSHSSCFQCHWQKGVEGRDQEPYANQCAECHRNSSLPMAAQQQQPAATQPVKAGAPASAVPTQAGMPATIPTPLSSLSALIKRVQFIPAGLTTPLPSSAPTPKPPVFVDVAGQQPWPARISPKFVHELDAHKMKTNAEGKEVPITCLQCHSAVRTSTALASLKERAGQVQLQTCATSACHTAVSGTAALKLSVFRELRQRNKEAAFDCRLCHLPAISTSSEVPCDHYAVVRDSAEKEKKSTKGIEDITPARCADPAKKGDGK